MTRPGPGGPRGTAAAEEPGQLGCPRAGPPPALAGSGCKPAGPVRLSPGLQPVAPTIRLQLPGTSPTGRGGPRQWAERPPGVLEAPSPYGPQGPGRGPRAAMGQPSLPSASSRLPPRVSVRAPAGRCGRRAGATAGEARQGVCWASWGPRPGAQGEAPSSQGTAHSGLALSSGGVPSAGALGGWPGGRRRAAPGPEEEEEAHAQGLARAGLAGLPVAAGEPRLCPARAALLDDGPGGRGLALPHPDSRRVREPGKG